MGADLMVDPAMASFSFEARPDTIYTVSTTTGQGHGTSTADIPSAAPFPESYMDDFDAYAVDAVARYFADFGGSWHVARDPTRYNYASGNMILKQWVTHQAANNQWAPDTDPISFIGVGLSDVTVSTLLYIPSSMEFPKPNIDPAHSNIQSASSGQCLGVAGKSTSSGGAIQTMTCTLGWNEQFMYDTDSGLIKVSTTNKCVTVGSCPSLIHSDVC